MSYLQFRISDYVFRPTWLGTLITLICIPVFIHLGQWQYGKAQQKQALQTLKDSYSMENRVALPQAIVDPEEWRYRQVKTEGAYQAQYQILLDNQVENGRAGYHVITPLQIKGTDRFVLVDRGWLPAMANHSELPEFVTPDGQQEVTGHVWVPSKNYYTLEKPAQMQQTQWQVLWQNLDMNRYATAVPFEVLPVVIRLDAESKAGGFSRNWPLPAPPDRITTHIGYAYQWFGFAIASFIIYIVVSFKRINRRESSSNAHTK